MNVILDETSLIPSGQWTPAQRIAKLAYVLKALDALGAPRRLRMVRGAAERDIHQGRGLRCWCFEPTTDRDQGRFLAGRLGKQPFIDGPDGLFAASEGQRAIEGRVDAEPVMGLALAALEDGVAVAVALAGETRLAGDPPIQVQLTTLETDEQRIEEILVTCFVEDRDVVKSEAVIIEKVNTSLSCGAALLDCSKEVFPRLRFGPKAQAQIRELTGNEKFFPQLLRHLRALNQGAVNWRPGQVFEPDGGLSWSVESKQTLGHRKYGPLRVFPPPEGFVVERCWSLHTKLTGGDDVRRLYFAHTESKPSQSVVLIGYFGPHLPTVKFSS